MAEGKIIVLTTLLASIQISLVSLERFLVASDYAMRCDLRFIVIKEGQMIMITMGHL